jgi:hypothetical protein
VAQLGHARLQRVDRLVGLRPSTRTSSLASRRARFRNHSWCCLSVPVGLQRVVTLATSACFSSLSRLALSSRRMSSTRVRFSRVSLQAVLGLAAALLVLGDTGGFFQEQAQLFGRFR